jgi:hypothetical protein
MCTGALTLNHVVDVTTPQPDVTTVMMTWIMKLNAPTSTIANRPIFVLCQSSFLEGFVASFRILLLSLMKELIPILSSRPYRGPHGAVRESINF